MTSRGFPNQFFTGFTQVGISANITANYELQGEHIAYVISEALRGVTTVEPSRRLKTVGQHDQGTPIDNSAFDACTPGYYNNEGGGGGEGIRSFLGELRARLLRIRRPAEGMARQRRHGGLVLGNR